MNYEPFFYHKPQKQITFQKLDYFVQFSDSIQNRTSQWHIFNIQIPDWSGCWILTVLQFFSELSRVKQSLINKKGSEKCTRWQSRIQVMRMCLVFRSCMAWIPGILVCSGNTLNTGLEQIRYSVFVPYKLKDINLMFVSNRV